ncbi:MAG TPA: hypothetical protein VMS75_07725 [Terriglobales bacterium]|nr:hypothetical protein [Terriglobales bacterium]
MKRNKERTLLAVAFLLGGAFALMGQTKVVSPAQGQRSPALKQPCADVAVVSFTARLLSTQVGDKSVEFPKDTVALEATLSNIGTLAISRATSYHVELVRNGEAIYARDEIELLLGPGTRRTLHWVETFPHNQKTTYALSVTTALAECRKDNNQATLTIDEKKLHPAKVNFPPKVAIKAPIKRP